MAEPIVVDGITYEWTLSGYVSIDGPSPGHWAGSTGSRFGERIAEVETERDEAQDRFERLVADLNILGYSYEQIELAAAHRRATASLEESDG